MRDLLLFIGTWVAIPSGVLDGKVAEFLAHMLFFLLIKLATWYAGRKKEEDEEEILKKAENILNKRKELQHA